MVNNYPYTDYHELNTDWIIGKIKNVETAEANTKQYAEDADAAKVAAEDAKDIAVAAKDDAVSAKDDAEDAKDYVVSAKDQLDLLQARVDNIIPDGTQTAGNTELLDIRVGANGIIYDSAGNAVRAQITEADNSSADNKAEINLLMDASSIVESSAATLLGTGYLDKDGLYGSSANWNIYAVDVSDGEIYDILTFFLAINPGDEPKATYSISNTVVTGGNYTTLTSTDIIRVGTVYLDSVQETKTENNIIIPENGKTLLIACDKVSNKAPSAVKVVSRGLVTSDDIESVKAVTGYNKNLIIPESVGAIYYADGTVNTSAPNVNAAYMISPMFHVTAGTEIPYKLRASDSYCMIAFYSEAGVYDQANSVIGTNAAATGVYTVPADGYVRLTLRNDLADKYAAYYVNGEVTEAATNIRNIYTELNYGSAEFVSFDGRYIQSDGTLVSGAWNAHKYACFPGSKIHIRTYMGAITTFNTPKRSYVFIKKKPEEVIAYNSYAASDVLDGSVAYTEISAGMFDYDVTVPDGAYTLIVSMGQNVYGLGTDISSYAKRACITSVDKSMLAAIADSVTNGVYEITNSFSFSPATPIGQCLIFSADARYTGPNSPTVKASYGPLFDGMEYNIGDTAGFKLTEFRIPPRLSYELTITVNIPAGTTLYLRQFDMIPDGFRNHYDKGIRLDAHLGFYGFAPENTLQSFEYAAKCGYSSCITVPKVTGDVPPVLVCIHDTTINRTALNADGTVISGDVYVDQNTYADLLTYDYSRSRDAYWRGAKLPTVEEFFEICAKTGMKPIFSTHPALTATEWQTVKDLLIKYDLLSKFTVKSFDISILETAFGVLGSDIDAYIGDDIMLATMQASTIDSATCRKGVELQFDNWTESYAQDVIDAGYFASAWSIGRRTSDEYKTLYQMGVTEFVDDYNCSSGLNW